MRGVGQRNISAGIMSLDAVSGVTECGPGAVLDIRGVATVSDPLVIRQNSWVAAAETPTPDSAITLTSEPTVALLSDGRIFGSGGGLCANRGAGIDRRTLRWARV